MIIIKLVEIIKLHVNELIVNYIVTLSVSHNLFLVTLVQFEN